ncbi:uncharacterized protein LOC144110414 [Amblyomma americanum]
MQYVPPCALSRKQPDDDPATHRVSGKEAAAPLHVQIPPTRQPYGEQVRGGSPLLVMSPSRAAGAVLLRRDFGKLQGPKSLEDVRTNQNLCFLVVLALMFAAVGWALASFFSGGHGSSGNTESKKPILSLSRQQLALHHRKDSFSGPQLSKDRKRTSQTAERSVRAEHKRPNLKRMTSARGRHFKGRSHRRTQTCESCGSKASLRRLVMAEERTVITDHQSIDRSKSLHSSKGPPAPTTLTVVTQPRDEGGTEALDNDNVSEIAGKGSTAGFENSRRTDTHATSVEVGNMTHQSFVRYTMNRKAEGAAEETVAGFGEDHLDVATEG